MQDTERLQLLEEEGNIVTVEDTSDKFAVSCWRPVYVAMVLSLVVYSAVYPALGLVNLDIVTFECFVYQLYARFNLSVIRVFCNFFRNVLFVI